MHVGVIFFTLLNVWSAAKSWIGSRSYRWAENQGNRG